MFEKTNIFYIFSLTITQKMQEMSNEVNSRSLGGHYGTFTYVHGPLMGCLIPLHQPPFTTPVFGYFMRGTSRINYPNTGEIGVFFHWFADHVTMALFLDAYRLIYGGMIPYSRGRVEVGHFLWELLP